MQIKNKFDLTIGELESLASEINYLILKNRGATISDYIEKVNQLSIASFGMRKGRAIKNEMRLYAYFPDKVYETLKNKANTAVFTFNESDKNFLIENQGRGIEWLEKRMYMQKDSIRERAKKLNIEIENKLIHKYTKDEDEYIVKNKDRGWKVLEKEMGINGDALRSRCKRLLKESLGRIEPIKT